MLSFKGAKPQGLYFFSSTTSRLVLYSQDVLLNATETGAALAYAWFLAYSLPGDMGKSVCRLVLEEGTTKSGDLRVLPLF